MAPRRWGGINLPAWTRLCCFGDASDAGPTEAAGCSWFKVGLPAAPAVFSHFSRFSLALMLAIHLAEKVGKCQSVQGRQGKLLEASVGVQADVSIPTLCIQVIRA